MKCQPTIIYAMIGFAGVFVIVLYIGIIMTKTRHEVRKICNGKFGLCDGCHQERDIVRLFYVQN